MSITRLRIWPTAGTATEMLVVMACLLLTAVARGQDAFGEKLDGRLQPNDMEYLGAFRLPMTSDKMASRFAYGGHAMAFNPWGQDGKGSLFIAGHDHHQLVAEISVAQPRKSRNTAELETTELLQPFLDVTGGLKQSLGDRHMKLGGLIAYDKTLLWSIYKWYNVDAETLPSHGASAFTLSRPSAQGLWRIGDFHSQRTGGFLCAIPEKWQKLFGFPMLTGQSRMQGRASSSEGPAAYGFNPGEATSPPRAGSILPSKEFLSYDIKHPAKYSGVDGAAHSWKGANGVAGMVFPVSENERKTAVVFIVKLGQHATDWYGVPEKFPGPGIICGGGGSGYHAPPYKAMAWFYDPHDLLAVSNGRVAPWAVRPYVVKDLSSDLFGNCASIGAVTYDAKSPRVYLLEQSADQRDPNESSPVIHVYSVR